MTYRVELSNRASRDLSDLYQVKHVDESAAAARWYNNLEIAVSTLANLPQRCPMAPEAKKSKHPLRHLLYGRRPHIYRAIYEIDERRKAVWVLTTATVQWKPPSWTDRKQITR